MSSWLATVAGELTLDEEEVRRRGVRAAIDLDDVGPTPRHRFSAKPVMDIELYKTTIIVQTIPLEPDPFDDDALSDLASDAGSGVFDLSRLEDLVMGSEAPTRRPSASSGARSPSSRHSDPAEAKSTAGDTHASSSRSLTRSSSRSRAPRSSSASLSRHGSVSPSGSVRSSHTLKTATSFVESKEMASLASKYSMLRKKKKKKVHSILVVDKVKQAQDDDAAGASGPSYTRALKERSEALNAIKGMVHGLVEVREYWEQNFCYLRFNTVAEAKFAQRHIHRAILDDGVIAEVVLNCFRA